MGLIKGSVGDDFVIPCVDFIVTATISPDRDPAGRGRRLPAHGLDRPPVGDRIRPGAGPGAVAVARNARRRIDAGYQWLEVRTMTQRPMAYLGQVLPMIDLNPLDWLGDAGQGGRSPTGSPSMMMALWSAGLWLLRDRLQRHRRVHHPRRRPTRAWARPVRGHPVDLARRRSGDRVRSDRTGALSTRRPAPRHARGRAWSSTGPWSPCWIAVCGAMVLGLRRPHQACSTRSSTSRTSPVTPPAAGWVDQVSGTVEAAVARGLCPVRAHPRRLRLPRHHAGA